jgi:hypothetical protein
MMKKYFVVLMTAAGFFVSKIAYARKSQVAHGTPAMNR